MKDSKDSVIIPTGTIDGSKIWCSGVDHSIVVNPKLVIFGTGSNAEIAYDYFTNESSYEVVAFTVERKYLGGLGSTHFLGLPVISFETLEAHYSPLSYEVFVAIGYLKLNHVRARIYRKAKDKGYKLATFISPHAYIGRNVQIGDNCFILEHNNVQYGAEIGNDSWLWASNHIGHETKIRKHVFLASGITVAGYCEIGDYTFIGCGVSTADNIKVGKNCLLGLNATLGVDLSDDKVCSDGTSYIMDFADLSPKSLEIFGW